MSHSLWSWVTSHWLVIYYVFAVLIEELPTPTPQSGGFYKYFYAVIQIFAANIRRSKDAVATPAPPAKP
jgi:hypothetical protein